MLKAYLDRITPLIAKACDESITNSCKNELKSFLRTFMKYSSFKMYGLEEVKFAAYTYEFWFTMDKIKGQMYSLKCISDLKIYGLEMALSQTQEEWQCRLLKHNLGMKDMISYFTKYLRFKSSISDDFS